MKRYSKFLMICILIFVGYNLKAQTWQASGVTGSNIKDVLEQHFLGEGVSIDVTKPILFNNSTTLSNQVGYFTNNDTTYENRRMPIKEGLLVTTASYSNLDNSSGYGLSDNGPTGSVDADLYREYKKACESLNMTMRSLNNIAILDFYVIPKGFTMSYKYSFGSKEYPNYVNDNYNDFFVLMVDGPYDDQGNPYSDPQGIPFYTTMNIAKIPGTEDPFDPTVGTPVMINTVNNGRYTPGVAASHPELFVDARNHTSSSIGGYGGFTKKLETQVLNVVPCRSYHIKIAICNVSDNVLNSTVFLEKGSFVSRTIDFYDTESLSENGDTIIHIKGCATDTLKFKANYIATADEDPYPFTTKPSDYSQLSKGADDGKHDYQVFYEDMQSSPSNSITIPEGDDHVNLVLKMYHNEDKAPGTVDTLYLIGKEIYGYEPCYSTDTVVILMKEPELMDCTVKGGATYCEDKLPKKDIVNIDVLNAVSYAEIKLEKADATGNYTTISNHKQRIGLNKIGNVTDTFEIVVASAADAVKYRISVTDSCNRYYETEIQYNLLGTQTHATVDKPNICEGDTIQLSCPVSDKYKWTSYPMDTSLMNNNKDISQSPKVWPNETTTYYIEVTSSDGCIAKDELKVTVDRIVKANMQLKPKLTTYSSSEVEFRDISANSFDRQWFFGDGTQEQGTINGIHVYPFDAITMQKDTNIYPVMLITYNQSMCADTAYDTVIVTADFTFFIPNAFVPNAQNPQQAFFGPTGKLLEDWEMTIFNRWGTKIFKGKKLWDGKLEDGSYAPQGTYVYDIMYKDGAGRTQRKTGTFAVLPNKD